MSKKIKSCYQCPHWEDLRYYWCHLLKKEISGIALGFPDDCPLESFEQTKTITIKGKIVKTS